MELLQQNVKNYGIERGYNMPVHIPVESMSDQLADAIKSIDESVKKMQASGINDEAIVLLLWHSIGQKNIRKTDIENVLWGLRNLKSAYLK